MRKVSEKTLKTILVNFKCVGYFGKAFTPFTKAERARIIDELIDRDWLTENMIITAEGAMIVQSNLNLCQH